MQLLNVQSKLFLLVSTRSSIGTNFKVKWPQWKWTFFLLFVISVNQNVSNTVAVVRIMLSVLCYHKCHLRVSWIRKRFKEVSFFVHCFLLLAKDVVALFIFIYILIIIIMLRKYTFLITRIFKDCFYGRGDSQSQKLCFPVFFFLRKKTKTLL